MHIRIESREFIRTTGAYLIGVLAISEATAQDKEQRLMAQVAVNTGRQTPRLSGSAPWVEFLTMEEPEQGSGYRTCYRFMMPGQNAKPYEEAHLTGRAIKVDCGMWGLCRCRILTFEESQYSGEAHEGSRMRRVG